MTISAQDIFKKHFKEDIAPEFRKRGFQGSGQKFRYKDDTHFIHVGIQKSQFSDSNNINFTMNLQFINKYEWNKVLLDRPHWPKTPSPNVFYGLGLNKRIGLLMPENRDLWWDLNDKSDLESLKNDIIEKIDMFIIPVIQKTTQQGVQENRSR